MKTYTMKDLERFDASDVAKMSRAELSKLVSAYASTANKRIVALGATEQGQLAPSYKSVIEGGGKFSVKGKSQGQLQAEFARVKRFLSQKTSTISGYKQVRTKVKENIGGEFKNISQEREFWRRYKQFERDNKELVKNMGSPQVMSLFYNRMDDLSNEDISDMLTNIYEETELEEYDDMPEWFEL